MNVNNDLNLSESIRNQSFYFPDPNVNPSGVLKTSLLKTFFIYPVKDGGEKIKSNQYVLAIKGITRVSEYYITINNGKIIATITQTNKTISCNPYQKICYAPQKYESVEEFIEEMKTNLLLPIPHQRLKRFSLESENTPVGSYYFETSKNSSYYRPVYILSVKTQAAQIEEFQVIKTNNIYELTDKNLRANTMQVLVQLILQNY